jgi:hypothetical protein
MAFAQQATPARARRHQFGLGRSPPQFDAVCDIAHNMIRCGYPVGAPLNPQRQ